MSVVRQDARPSAGLEVRWLVGTLAAIAILVWGLERLHVTNPTIVSLLFLLVVFLAAAQSTLRVAIVASIVAVGCVNYFFLPPVRTFAVIDPQNWVALLTLLAVSVAVSRLSTQVRTRALEAVTRREELTRLFDLTRDILLTTDAGDPIAAIAGHIRRRFLLSGVVISQSREGAWVRHEAGDAVTIDARDLEKVMQSARATLEFDAEARAYAGAGQLRAATGESIRLEPLRIGMTPIGVLALQGVGLAAGARDAIAGVTAIAVERLQLLDERKEADLVRRGAELKSALLASLSHDLRTPLTAVTVAANNLRGGFLTEGERDEQLDLVQTELVRLNRLFENIVDMARIETQAVSAEPQWVQPAEVIRNAADHVAHALGSHSVEITGDADDVLVHIDPRLTSAALAHLLENAAQYSPPGGPIDVAAAVHDGELQLTVRDHGPGIAPADMDHVFDRLYRGASGRTRFGTGMGLAIARGLLAAEGGRVWVANHPDGGAVFTLAVPVNVRPLQAWEGEVS